MFTDTQVKYHTEITTATMNGKLITVENRTPILPPEQRAKRKQEIERQLYGVFIKYAKNKGISCEMI